MGKVPCRGSIMATDASLPNNQRKPLHLFLRHVVATLRDESRSDAELLSRFVVDGDQNAFHAVVARHSRSVWAVCLANLSDSHDAEDAFQVTFMALARRAASVDARNGVGPWLWTTARRAALHLRRSANRFNLMRFKLRTTASPQAEAALPDEDATWVQVATELERLPDHLREAVVLYHLEGQTLSQIAEVHQCSVTLAHRRVTQGVELLRNRLSARGVALTASALIAALPTGLVWGATTSASAFTSGDEVPRRLADLVENILAPSVSSSLVKIAGVLTLLVAGAAVCLSSQGGAPKPLPLQTTPDGFSAIRAPIPKEAEVVPEVRVVGVYEGTRLPIANAQPGERAVGIVTVKVGNLKKPTVLVLMSYEPVIWKVDAPKNAVVKVIASGYHKQAVAGLDEKVPIKLLSYDARDKDYFYAYRQEAGPNEHAWEREWTRRAYARVVERVKELTGQSIKEFQGEYTGETFEIR